ncbi:type I polyketide synthase [Rhodococcoides kyotonense]|uniref:type I polyketide synthase n=1 Tax=Rhodococcoides kyotonense TaxID=398843 RepID=UPI001595A0BF
MYRFLETGEVDGDITDTTYSSLAKRSRAIGATLQQRELIGRNALMLYPPGMDFVEAFYGCMFGGIVAIPVPLPQFHELDRGLRRLRQIIADADVAVVLANRQIIDGLATVVGNVPALAALDWIATDEIASSAESSWRDLGIGLDATAFLQYTSGSTSAPKGVIVSHGNLLHNATAMAGLMGHTPDRVASWEGAMTVSWLPVYHDMGLIGPVLGTVFTGGTTVLMSPLHFLQKPERWLRAMSKFRGHTSGSPNFGYELCVRRATPELLQDIDLSSWHVAFNGAEPIRASTVRNFTDKFRPAGFRDASFMPGYGLAEATLMVTGSALDTPPRVVTRRSDEQSDSAEWVSSGRPGIGMSVVIVDPHARAEVPAEEIGEIWVSGGSVAQGYLGDEAKTAEVFDAVLDDGRGPFMRTGDLGFVLDGELFVTGRSKDLLIIDGKNHYPQDIELTVEEADPAVRPGCIAAFSVDDVTGGERPVVVAELKPTDPGELERIESAVRAAVSRDHGLGLESVVLIEPRSIFKTSSGKIQRQATRAAYLAGELHEIQRPGAGTEDQIRPPEDEILSAAETISITDVADIEAWLSDAIAARADIDSARVDVDRPLAEFGLGSRALVELTSELSATVGRTLEPSLLFEHPTIAKIAAAIGSERGDESTPDASFTGGDIAIVATACRFPGGADSPEQLWQLLEVGTDVVGSPSERGWNAVDLLDDDPDRLGRAYSLEGGYLADISAFDAAFFGIGEQEARAMDPQQRLLLQVAWEAIERAGIDPLSLSGSPTGVYVGLYDSGYGSGLSLDQLNGHIGTGSAGSVASGRISYALGLEGPALTIDTACSSSLVAMHLAAQALRAGECDMALAGGVTVMTTPRTHVEFSRLRGLASSGKCSPFSADADGVVWAEGCGLVLLKRLDDAVRDQDPILAVMTGSAVNQDGRSQGLSAPNGIAQERVLKAALRSADLEPDDIDYVEAHGTGTPLGDPIEARALARVFGSGRPSDRPLRIGSLKSNLGHLQAAAGVGGVIKMVEALQHEILPQTLHSSSPSPHANWAGSGLALLNEPLSWPAGERTRRVGVSAFGISGTNAHVILQEAPRRPIEPPLDSPVALFPVSARSENSLRGQGALLLDTLDADPTVSLPALARTLAVRRSHFERRAVVVARDRSELRGGVVALAQGGKSPYLVQGLEPALRSGKVAFVFPGQGSQWAGMARRLIGTDVEFGEEFDRCDATIRRYTGWSVAAVLRGDDGAPRMDSDDVVQPVLFAVMVSLAAVWRARGIEPSGVVGHSQGEIAAAYVAGALGLADAAAIVVFRSRHLTETAGRGGMAVVNLSEDQLKVEISSFGASLTIAAVNSGRSVVVAGDSDSLDGLLSALDGRNIFTRRLSVDYASHSAHVESVKDALNEDLSEIIAQPRRTAWYSTVTGERLPVKEIAADYWYRNLREPVQFSSTVERMVDDGYRYFVEMSPHPALVAPILTVAADAGRDVIAVGSLRRDEDAHACIDRATAELHVGGLPVDWERFVPSTGYVRLPTYAWDTKTYWMDSKRSDAGDPSWLDDPGHPLLAAVVQRPDTGGVVLMGMLSADRPHWISDHSVSGTVLLPGTALVELALRAAREVHATEVRELVLKAPVIVSRGTEVQLQVVVDAAGRAGERPVSIYSRIGGHSDLPWTLHARGSVGRRTANGVARADEFEFATEWPPFGAERLELDGVYQLLAERGYRYGPAFQGLREAWRDGDDVYAEVALPDDARDGASFSLHPALLDSALHALILGEVGSSTESVLLPFAWSGISLVAGGASELRVRLSRVGERRIRMSVADGDGRVVASVESLMFADVSLTRLAALSTRIDDAMFTVDWVASPYSAPLADVGWHELNDDADHDEASQPVLTIVPKAETEVGRTASDEVVDVLARVQRWLVEHPDDRTLVVVTAGAVAAEDGENVRELGQSSVWGLLRAAQTENPDRIVLLDVEESTDMGAAVSFAVSSGEPQLAIRGGSPLVPRLVRSDTHLTVDSVPLHGTILITGGTGSLGRSVARHLARNYGVEHLVLISRTGVEASGVEELLSEVEILGVEVTIARGDVADRKFLADVLEQLPAEQPLSAVVHCAGQLSDNIFASTTPEDIDRVFRAKVDGAWNLHLLTRHLDLSAFVLFSSAAGILGSPGQAGYAAANTFLDALAARRRSEGLPAVSLAWGLWEQQDGLTGHLSEQDTARLARGGMSVLSMDDGLRLLDASLGSVCAVVVPARIDARAFAYSVEVPAVLRDLVELESPTEIAADTTTAIDFTDMLTALDHSAQERAILELVRQHASAVVGEGTQIDSETPFKDIGIDSLGAMEFRNRLHGATGIKLHVTAAMDYPTPVMLAKYLHTNLLSSV